MKSINPLKNSGMEEIELKAYPAKDTGWEVKLEEKRENTASLLAKIIVVLFAVMVLSSLCLLLSDKYSTKVADYIEMVLPSISTLIGVVFGFYFSQSRIK
jgi:hypothetical protein